MKLSTKFAWAALAAAVFGVMVFPVIGTAESTTTSAPATSSQPASTKAAARSMRMIRAELDATSGDLSDLIPSAMDMLDPKVRKEQGAKAVPLLKKMAILILELGQTMPAPMAEEAPKRAVMYTAFAALLEDKESIDALQKMAGDADKTISLRGKLAQQMVEWWKSNKDEKGQEKVIEALQKLATESPKEDQIAETLMVLKNMGAASEEVGDKALAIIATTLTGPEATEMKQSIAAQMKVKEALNKPIELAAKTVDGKDFSTKEYKGKVVLIDFWATWCGPCKAELPHVKEIYKKYHEKGLEIVGVSCDSSAEALTTFTKKEEMPWVQLWDPSQAEEGKQWHALAKQWNVDGIPTMFLIDRNGLLRTMEARESLDTMIPKLLDEKEGAKAEVKKEEKADMPK